MNNMSFFINIWVTLQCNFRCRYCYVEGRYDNIYLNMDKADDIIEFIKRNIKKNQVLIVNFHGGEPTLNFSTIKYIVLKIENEIDNKALFGMTTNGSLLDDNMIKFISEKFEYNISVSLDGKEETHNKNRICINKDVEFNTILRRAKRLLTLNSNTRIRMTFDNKNIYKLYENIIFFIENGFKIIVPVADYFSKDWKDEHFTTIKNQLNEVKEYIKRNKLNDINLYEISNNFKCLGTCNAGHDYYNIDVFGNIYPCTNLVGQEEWKIGDVYKGVDDKKISIIDGINSKKVKECEGCKLYNCCVSTRCLLINYATTGEYYKPNLVQCNMLNIKLDLVD